MATRKKPNQPAAIPGMTNTPLRPIAITQDIVDAAPNLYADSLLHVGIGPFISKMTLGLQSPGAGKVNAIQTIILPTNAMVDLARNILLVFAGSYQGVDFGKSYQQLLKAIDTLEKADI